MRSPVRGTHRAFPLRFFVTVPITSLKFWANIPTCFPNIFTVSSPLWILRMQQHAGKQGTCRCIPRSCIFRMLVIVNYELHCTKNRSKPWWDRGCEPGLQYLCNHRSFVNSSNLPSLGSTKAKRPNRLITLKLCLTKKKTSHFHRLLLSAKISGFQRSGKSSGPFLTQPTRVSHSLQFHWR